MTPEGDVHVLTDVQLIHRLKAAYLRLVDEKAWSRLDELFTDDFVFSGIWSSRGGHEFVQRTSRSLAEAITIHRLGDPRIDLTSPAAAAGVWPFDDVIDERKQGLGLYRRGSGHYHERYVKADGTWKISAMRITRERVECTVFLAGGETRRQICTSQEELLAWLELER